MGDVMLGAYVADLTSVGPSLKAYSEAVSQLANLDKSPSMKNRIPNHRAETSWSGSLKSLISFVDIKKEENSKSIQSVSSSAGGEIVPERIAFEKRVRANERMLRESLTKLCRSTQIRAARISHKYF